MDTKLRTTPSYPVYRMDRKSFSSLSFGLVLVKVRFMSYGSTSVTSNLVRKNDSENEPVSARRLTFLLSALHRSGVGTATRASITNGICAHIKIDCVHKTRIARNGVFSKAAKNDSQK